MMLYERLWQDYWTTADCMTLIDEKNIHSQHATVNFLLKYKQRAFKETSLLLRITLAGALIEDTYLSSVSESRKYLNRYLILYANNIYQVPTLFSLSKMIFNKPRIELISFIWILLLYQTPDALCAPLQNHSLKSSSDIHRNSNILNLSDLLEFSPLNLPKMRDNISDQHQEVSGETTPEIMTFKLKTRLIIHNKDSSKQRTNDTNEEIKIITPNENKSSLSDIEYVDPSDDFEFWRWTANKRTRKLNYIDEKSSVDTNKTENKNSSQEVSSKTLEIIYDSDDSEENKISEEVNRSKYATGRQFVFHPYLPYVNPYSKNTNPDEKISFDDILPVKMVKFIKSMVEEAPWEQMFMKMVRMIVDQFVDKIIEKMFADKDHDKDHFKKRSFEVVLSPTFVLPTFKTPVIRLKRSVASETSNDQDDDIFRFLPPKRDEQDIGDEDKKGEKKSWLDHFLDYLFPNTKSDMVEENPFDRLKKRDTTNTHFFKTLLTFFLSTFEKSSGILSDAKDVLRYKMLKEFLPYLYQKKYMNNDFDSYSNSVDRMRMTHRKSPDNVIKRKDASENLSTTSRRSKRSTRDDFRKDDEDRLWQAHSRRQRPPNHRSHDECSLRKACNAGRLLSRIPSVQEITLQLRSSGNEPHWDALIWGMKKKRCSRLFCKRQRSPKGSRYSWHDERPRFSRKDEMVTELPDMESDFSNNLKL